MSEESAGGAKLALLAATLDVEDVRSRVEELRREWDERGDDEKCHAMEDDIWEAVLLAVAVGNPDAQPLAAAALRTKELDFARWCA